MEENERKQKKMEEDNDDDDDVYNFDEFDYGNTNLNKMTTQELNKHKNYMDKGYEKNAILPGSEQFVYDVQKDFNYEECDNSWDEEI